jgi:lipopolysaccharide transport system ATP-binding protein
MSNTVIKVENISKQYRLGDVSTGTLSHDLNRWWHTVRGKEDPYLKIGETNDRTQKGNSDYVWALRDINFEVQQGEVLGIIGRNGAGKSTLLKILSRTTVPTTGSIKIKGRVASLLEVGTGFHPELSGRENIFLNGAILGMTKHEIKRKFDEIVDFAGVERYIDTPVKRYSSGMYVRLAFGVAAHLEPEILIVDEVLAVGDAEFQKKALGKMKDVSNKDGRTVLFVSHNMAAIQKLCNSGLLLQYGKVIANGEVDVIVDKYLEISQKNRDTFREFENDKSKVASVIKVELTDEEGNQTSDFALGKPWIIKLYYQVNEPIENFICAVGLTSSMDVALNSTWNDPQNLKPGIYCTEFKESVINYAIGTYKVQIGLSIGNRNFQHFEDALTFNIASVIEMLEENVIKYDSGSGVILNQIKTKTYKID